MEMPAVRAGEPARLEDADDRLGEGLPQLLVFPQPRRIGDDQLDELGGDPAAQLAEVEGTGFWSGSRTRIEGFETLGGGPPGYE